MKCSLPEFGTRLASDDKADAVFDAVLIIKWPLLILEKEITLGSLMKLELVVLVDNAVFTTDEILPRPEEVTADVAERRRFPFDPIVK